MNLPHIKIPAKRLDTRESWMLKALPFLKALLIKAGAPDFADPQVSMSLPSKGALSTKRKRIGECWDKRAGKSGTMATVFISPVLSDPVEILEVLTHELVHVAVGTKAGHGPEFKKVALAVGLTGPMRATTAGAELKKVLGELATKLGKFTHDPLTNYKSPMKKQTTRMRLYVCENCGCKIRKASDTFMAMHYCEEDIDGPSGMFMLKDSPNLKD